MVSQSEFAEQVADAYAHLYDLAYLRAHPLVDLLIPDASATRKEKGWRLHRMLLDIISEIKPEPGAAVHPRRWRRHQLMVLRYLKGLDPQAIADRLTIGRRHFYREHGIAVQEIASLLWDRHVASLTSSTETSPTAAPQAASSRLELLRLEAARMAQADRYASLEDVIRGVLPLLEEIRRQHQLEIELALDPSLPVVAMDRGILRQILLGTLGYLSNRANRATIRLSAHPEEVGALPVIRLSATVQPPSTSIPLTGESGEPFAAFQEMATLYDAHLYLANEGSSESGFELELQVAQRPVLVIDDNEDELELLRRYLSPHNYRVVTAQTAEEALDLARRLQPHAITLDLMMPRRDGWEVLQVLLNQPETCHIPILVCSVLRQKEMALSLGATAFLEKPVTEQALLAALRALEHP